MLVTSNDQMFLALFQLLKKYNQFVNEDYLFLL